ncbi:MAG: DNA recombination protein RmuC [Kiritimatiellales bacterium]|nr:DNA recombination protein RmuC [Kiritimatiellota bacterium]MBL7011720.1 DNA recombination protein RmuC [Kiritimatiellales bacterium]
MEIITLIVICILAGLVLLQLAIALHGNAQQSTRLEMLTRGLDSLTEQTDARARKSEEVVEKLVAVNNQRLEQIGEKVEQRLEHGFDKTSKVFQDVLKRLVEIDKAQEKIAELSGNVVSLKEILSDKRSRGAFGEVQLSALISNMMPENSYSLQHTFDNGVRADCVLFLPEPTGTVCIDSKFPLESYQRMTDLDLGDADRAAAERQFRQDIKKHIKDIASKYILPGQTSDGAMMFIPAEAIFAEIHSHYPDLVEDAQHARVWLVSPTTMMAVLTTARAVLKDAATRQQVHIIQEHLSVLAQDFGRFQTRMDKLAAHISQAHDDVGQVKISAQKISSRFEKIEKVDLAGEPPDALDEPADDELI